MCREYILKTAKALVEDTKLLVSGAGASQEKLAQAAQSSVATITKLADVVKLGAASLGAEDPETQVRSARNLLRVCPPCASSQITLFPKFLFLFSVFAALLNVFVAFFQGFFGQLASK